MQKRGIFDIFKDILQDVSEDIKEWLEGLAEAQKEASKPTAPSSPPKQERPPVKETIPPLEPKPTIPEKEPEIVAPSDDGMEKKVIIEPVEYKNYLKNPHIKLQAKEQRGYYTLFYDFKDHKSKLHTFQMTYNMKTMQQMIQQFGFPRRFVGTFRMTTRQMQRWMRERDRALESGLFMLDGNTVRPDPSAIVNYYTEEFCQTIAEQILERLNEYGMDTRRERIEMAMKFIQDFPYAIPYHNDEYYMYGGVLTPPQLLYLQYGDCDSKAFLFAGILTYLIPAEDIAFLTLPEHMLVAIREDAPDKGMLALNIDGQTYVLAETAGPTRNNYGAPSPYKVEQRTVHHLQFTGSHSPYPYGNFANTQHKHYDVYEAPREAVSNDFVLQLHKLQRNRVPIKSMVFTADGGWLIIAGKNKYYEDKIPKPLLVNLKQLRTKGTEITDIALNDDGEFVVVYHDGYGFSSSLYEQTAKPLIPHLNEITEKRGQPIREIAFTHHKQQGWLVVFGRRGNGFSCHVAPQVGDNLRPIAEKATKKGIKSISFNRRGGWAMVYDRNGFYLHLPKQKRIKNELTRILNQIQNSAGIINRIYFTPTDDWVIIYNSYQFVTSLKDVVRDPNTTLV